MKKGRLPWGHAHTMPRLFILLYTSLAPPLPFANLTTERGKMDFSRSMSGVELSAFLEEQGLEGEDLRKIRGQFFFFTSSHDVQNLCFSLEGGYDGTSILLLSANKAQPMYALGLTAAANMVLEILFEVSWSRVNSLVSGFRLGIGYE